MHVYAESSLLWGLRGLSGTPSPQATILKALGFDSSHVLHCVFVKEKIPGSPEMFDSGFPAAQILRTRTRRAQPLRWAEAEAGLMQTISVYLWLVHTLLVPYYCPPGFLYLYYCLIIAPLVTLLLLSLASLGGGYHNGQAPQRARP